MLKKYWPYLLWVFFIGSGINGGLEFAAMDIQPKDNMPFKFYITAIALCVIMFGFVAFINNVRKRSKKIKPYLLGGLFFSIFGFIGIIKCLIIQAPTINEQILVIILFSGIGILIGWLFSIRIKKKRGSGDAFR